MTITFDTSDSRPSPQLESLTIARLAAEVSMLRTIIASLEQERDADKQERRRLNEMLQASGKFTAELRFQLKAAQERVRNLIEAIAPCTKECPAGCADKALCELARRYSDPLDILRRERLL